MSKFYRQFGFMLPSCFNIRHCNFQCCMILFVICLVFFWRCLFLYQEAQTRYFQVTVQGPITGTAYLYYDQGYGVNEHDSVVALISNAKPKIWNVLSLPENWIGSLDQFYRFQLTPSIIYALRFDPDISSGTIQIKSLEIVDGLGNPVQLIDFSQLHLRQQVKLFNVEKHGGALTVELKEGKSQINIVFTSPLRVDENQPFLEIAFIVRMLIEGVGMVLIMAILFALFRILSQLETSITIISKTIGYLQKPVNQDAIIFVVLTALFLWCYRPLATQWFPVLFEKALLFLFVILSIRYFMVRNFLKRRMNPLLYGMLFYCLLIIISVAMHYFAANSVGMENYISIYGENFKGVLFQKHESIKRLKDQGSSFIYFFPFMFLTAVSIFRSNDYGWKKLVLLPLIFVPCVLVALYQVYFDSSFLNYRPNDDPMGGLGFSFVSFRFSLFLIFPLCCYSAIIMKPLWKKGIFLLLAVCIFWLTRLSLGRAAILGELIFVLAVPLIMMWVYGGRKRKIHVYKYVVFFLFFMIVLLTGFALPKYHGFMSGLFQGRIVATTHALIKGDLTVKGLSDRVDDTQQAWRLAKTAPVSGWGPAAFMKNVSRTRFAHGDSPGNRQPMTNLYLQFLSNFGVIGVGSLIFLNIMPLWMIVRVRKKIKIDKERWAVGIVFVTVLIMLLLFNTNPNIDHPEINWLYSLYLGFLVSIALKYGYVSHLKSRWVYYGLSGLFLIGIFIGGTYRTTFGSHGYEAIQKELLADITSGYHQDDSVTIWDSEQVTEGSNVSNTLIKTRGNPFRVKYVNNVFRMQATSKPSNLQMNSDLFCIRTSIVKQGDHGSFILGVRVLVNNKPIEKHNFYIEGEKMLYYKLPESNGNNAEIKVEIDLRKSIPYHQDYRTEVTQEYMPHHIDYKDLSIKVDVISFTSG